MGGLYGKKYHLLTKLVLEARVDISLLFLLI